MKKKIKILVIVLLSVIISFYISTIIVYDSIFNYRCTSTTYLMPNINDYQDLESVRYEFNTRKNNKLVGYLYSNRQVEEKALIVFSHGLGKGGQIGYLEIFNYLSSHGYYVFAYDATANDESSGKSIGGLPQGIIDLDYAINFTKTIEEVKDLPLMLMGYSWGAYSASNVLNYQKDIKAIVSIAGWNESINLIEYKSSEYIGGFSKVLSPFVRIHEFVKYGKYALSKAMDAFDNTDAKIMIVHSEDDLSVPIGYGYYTYYEKYKDNDNFIFKHYENRGHSGVFNSEDGMNYYNDFISNLEVYKDNNGNLTEEDIINYVNKNIDREKLANRLDYDLFNEIIKLYDSCL